MNSTNDDRSPAAKAMSTAIRIMTICATMVLPSLGGYWLDQQIGTVVLFTLLGLVAGMTVAVMQLIRLVSSQSKKNGVPNGDQES